MGEADEETARGSTAAKQGGYLFVVAGSLALVGIPATPGSASALVGVAVADLVVALLCFLLPWSRWPVSRVAWVSLAGFAVAGFSTWAFDGFIGGTLPFYVLIFVWLGLHQAPRAVWWAAVPATVSYAGGLVLSDAPPPVMGSTVVGVPVMVTVGLVISRYVRHLQDAEQQLRAQERWRTAMVSALAHDVRSPLTAIAGVLEIVGDDERVPAHLRPMLDSATRQTHHLTRLAGGLLDLERVEHGKLQLQLEDLDVTEIAAGVVQLTDPGKVTVDIPPGTTVHADRDRLEQILLNLTNNALRHGLGPVEIGARSEPGAMVLAVRDHGPGISDRDASRLFTRLAEGRPHTDSVGLGLWIVRILTEAHGGTVSFENTDPGAVFLVRLPAPA
ncbi:sensor histidine kinase [Promicromonospora panici]|uniref:sensor histidine kinase n=1 Tax=Promicromonospora panici TaxID=2219658 RepID=UPI0013EE10E5|nr:HAMP domain-containing sensor histidine kinase [Promicromonospora panici]